MKLRQACGLIVVAATVAACVPTDSHTTRHDAPWKRTVVEPPLSDPDRLTRYCDRMLTLKPSELAGELDAARLSFNNDQSELNRLQLALLLSLPGTSFRNDSAAIALLRPLTKDTGQEGSTLRPLAIWLHSELLEFRRIEETSQQQTAKLREELRRNEETLQQQAAKLKDEQRRAEALQQKLEAILEMEMKMIEREQNLPKKK